jgi:hypothetical protein
MVLKAITAPAMLTRKRAKRVFMLPYFPLAFNPSSTSRRDLATNCMLSATIAFITVSKRGL